MTREIKFRAKIIDRDNHWVYGFLAKGPMTLENGPASHFGSGTTEEWYIIEESGLTWIIDPKTVGQSTER